MQKSLIISLLSALVLVIFALKNSTPVELDFIIGNKVQGSLSLILIITAIFGIFLGLLLSYPSILKQKKKVSENQDEITKLNTILDEYKKEYGISNKAKVKEQEDKEDTTEKEN